MASNTSILGIGTIYLSRQNFKKFSLRTPLGIQVLYYVWKVSIPTTDIHGRNWEVCTSACALSVFLCMCMSVCVCLYINIRIAEVYQLISNICSIAARVLRSRLIWYVTSINDLPNFPIVCLLVATRTSGCLFIVITRTIDKRGSHKSYVWRKNDIIINVIARGNDRESIYEIYIDDRSMLWIK